MEFEVIKENGEEAYYIIERKNSDGLKIIEINKKNHEYHAFVLIKYHTDLKSLDSVKKLYEYYKLQQETTCFIGCSDGDDSIIETEEGFNTCFAFSDYFDLYYPFPEEGDFEILVQACYSCCCGEVHSTPTDWLCLREKQGNSFGLNFEDAASFEDAVNKMIAKFQRVKNIAPEKVKICNAVVSILNNEVTLTLDDLQNIQRLQRLFEEDYSCIMTFNNNYKGIKKGMIRLVIITG